VPSYVATAPPGQYGATPPALAQPPAVGGQGGFGQQSGSYNYQQGYQSLQPYYGANGSSNYSAPPQISNPFPAPSANSDDYDPEMAAQIAQWQSAYMPKDVTDPAAGKGGRMASGGMPSGSVAATTGPAGHDTAKASAEPSAEKKKTVYREGGGKKWADDSLLEWDPSHLRLFVGNLAGETTDESLLKAFSRWRSVQKAKVVRDKRTTKSKGFGFVSFSDPDDFFQAAKEMNGKYIQSHPVVVRKSTTEIKPQNMKDDRHGKGKHKKAGNKSGNGLGDGGKQQESGNYEPHLGPLRAGVTKPGQKTRGGLKFLG
jgi:hypothetical protein